MMQKFGTSVLKAYQSKDAAKVFSMVVSPPPASVIEQIVPGTPNYEQLFGENSKQWKAVSAWDGEFEETVMNYEAYVVLRQKPSAFGPGNPDVFSCIRLKKENGTWHYDTFYIAQQKQVNGPEFSEAEDGSELHAELNKTTSSVVQAFHQKDIEKIKALSVAEGPAALRGESERTVDERLFNSLDMKEIAEWPGTPGKVFLKDEAKIKFGESENATHWVQLIKADSGWRLKDIKLDSK
ncbi:MAG: hypothetical protein AAGA58_12765 [Verrucomicrobiota bacterium]